MTNSVETTGTSVAVLSPVEFAGATLYVVEHEGKPFAPMKAIVEGMGLAWQAQLAKLNANPLRWGVTEIVIPSAGGLQSMVCIALYKLAGWLTSISPNKVKDLAVRERVIKYQNECDTALWDYWNTGHAIRTTAMQPDKISPAQRQHLRELVQLVVDSGKQGHGETWNRLHRKFKVNEYKELSPSQFDDAVEYLHGKLDGESMAALVQKHFPDAVKALEAPAPEPKQEGMDFSFLSLKNKRLLLSYDHNGRELIQRVPNEAMLVTWQEVAHILREHYLMVSLPQITEIINAGCDAIVKRMQGKMIAA